MAAFPAGEVERIINEEIVRGQGTTLWTKPQARRRYQKVLATLVLGESVDGPVSGLMGRIIDGHYELAPYCTEHERIFSFPPDAVGGLTAFLGRLREVIHDTLSARSRWPADALMPHENGAQFLHGQFMQLSGEIDRMAMIARVGERLGLHSARAILLDQTLQVCRYLLLTGAQGREFDEHYGRAQAMLREATPLFNMPVDASVN